MQIHTTARHCELDPEDRLFAEERIGKLTKFARDILEARLIVSRDGTFRHSAEITLKLKRHDMVSREEADGTRVAIDRAADRLEQQLRRLKERRVDHKRSGGRANGPAPSPDSEAETGESDDEVQ